MDFMPNMKDWTPEMWDAFNGKPCHDVKLEQTMIDAYGRHLLVSTINRDSSSIYCPSRYAETIVFDRTTSPMKILDMGEACEGSRRTHDAMVLKWSKENPKEGEDDSD